MSALHTLPIPFVNPDDMEDTGAQILALLASCRSFDRMADALAADLAANRARIAARTQELVR